MDTRNNVPTVFDRLHGLGFALAGLATAGAVGAAFVDFDVAKPLAFIAGGLIATLVLASIARGDAHVVPDASVDMRTNPATGLPMLDDSLVDIRGNAFGRNDR